MKRQPRPHKLPQRWHLWLLVLLVPSGVILGVSRAAATWVNEVQAVMETVGSYDPEVEDLLTDLEAYVNDFYAFYSEMASGDVLGAFNAILGALGLPAASSAAQVATATLEAPETPEQVYEVGQRGDTAIPTQVQGYAYALLDPQGQESAAQMQQLAMDYQQQAAAAQQTVAQEAATAASSVETAGNLADLAGTAAEQALSRSSTQEVVKDLSQISAYAAGVQALSSGQLATLATQNGSLSTQLSTLNAQQTLTQQQLMNLQVGQAYQVLALNTLNSSVQQQLQYAITEQQRMARDAFVSGAMLYIPGLATHE